MWRRIITDVFGVPSTLIKERARYLELLEPGDRYHQICGEFFDL